MRASIREGLTLLEVTVVLAIISVVMAIALPAVSWTREATRRTVCANHLRQISLAVHQFHNSHRRLPANGWGYRWMGDATRGIGPSQPGGWIFQSLPYIEQSEIYESARAGSEQDLRSRLAAVAKMPAEVFRCPSRPGSVLGPHSAQWNYVNSETPLSSSKSDYAINAGDRSEPPYYIAEGPGSSQDDVLNTFVWMKPSDTTGVSWQRGSARLSDIIDGTSHTYMIGEKRVSVLGYDTSIDLGHDGSMLSGVDIDIARFTSEPPARDGSLAIGFETRFGSAHPSGFNVAMCDGSVDHISFDIEAIVHRESGSRNGSGWRTNR